MSDQNQNENQEQYNLPKIVDYIDNFPDSIPNLSKLLSVQTFVPPGSEIYDLHDYNKCYASQGNAPSISMKPVDAGLHTVDDCIKTAAEKQMAFNTLFSSNMSPNTGGLNYNIYDGYSSSYMMEFYGKFKVLANGITSNLSSIDDATGNKHNLSTHWTGTGSVQLDGFFIPDKTGIWTFTVTSNIGCFIWIGDIAITGFNENNTVINTINGSKTYNAQFTTGSPYRIRIIFGGGMQNTTPTFSLAITNPDNNVSHGEQYLVTNLDEKNVAYFALEENTPGDTEKGLFKCYTTDTMQKGVADQLNAPNSGFNLQTIWQLFDKTEISNMSEGNYLQHDGSELVVCNQNNKKLSTLGKINTENNFVLGGDFGDITIGGVNTTNNKIRNPYLTPVSNPLFLNTYTNYLQNKQIDLSVIKPGDKLYCLPENFTVEVLKYSNLHEYVRISNDGCFILFFSEGNLLISTNNSPCVNSDTSSTYGNIKYTQTGSQSFYPYSVNLNNSNTNANLSYLVFEDKKTNKKLKNPLSKAVIGSKMNTTSNYSSYYDYVPPQGSNTVSQEQANGSCSTLCDNNPSCNYYYSYKTKDGNNYCSYDNEYSTPKYTGIKSNPNIVSSTLNVKHLNVTGDHITDPMEKQFMAGIRQKIITDSSILDEYKMDPNLTYDWIYKKLTEDYHKAISLAKSMNLKEPDYEKKNQELLALLGRINTNTINWEGFASMASSAEPIREGYVNSVYMNENGYKDDNVASATPAYGEGVPKEYTDVTSTGLIGRIINDKINPLEETAANYSAMLRKINSNYEDITGKVRNINTVRNYLNQNPKYDFSGNMLMGDYYDDNGNLVKFNRFNPSIEDAVVEDTSTMMYRENSVYILGSITAAALLIAAVTIARG